ncbi:type II secretion system F family protein [Candidatus Woesearchaeota archaeon]|nr:type II secretion system F family protein [Candidatus Woesearchaeota archaeon]
MSDAKQFVQEAAELIRELQVYESYKEELLTSAKRLYSAYQKGRYGYLAYQQKLKELLRDKTEEEWLRYYNAYIYGLLKRIEYLLTQAFYLVHKDESYEDLSISKPEPEAQPAKAKTAKARTGLMDKIKAVLLSVAPFRRRKVFDLETELKKLEERPAARSLKLQRQTEADRQIAALKERMRMQEERRAARQRVRAENAEPEPVPIRAAPVKQYSAQYASKKAPHRFEARIPASQIIRILALPQKLLLFILLIIRRVIAATAGLLRKLAAIRLKKPHATAMIKAKPKPEKIKPVLPMPSRRLPSIQAIISKINAAIASALHPKKRTIFVEEIVEMERQEKREAKKKAEGDGVVVGWFSGLRLLKEAIRKELLGRFSKKQERVLSEQTSIPAHIKKLREMRAKLYAEERLTGFETTLLAREAKRVKKILEAEKPEVYKGSSVGMIANVTVRRISLFLVDNFPTFFGYLYNALRAANIRILSNTYVNIMILSTIALSILTAFSMLALFFILNYPLYQIFLRSIIFGLVAGLLCATIFYSYPFIRIKERRRSTTTNLPFAINHMASVATSGVPPATMFELISGTAEYGEVAVEIKKIVDFINIFGYDLLTAMRSVASTTPSPSFKEFLEGMVSTIETGGDLESYLRQKADEATTTYQLERQRYNESISTYSDIYTGLLIAAPLFFVAALALVNLLGGTIGGMSVDTVMALGAYAAIPVLNIAFLLFLQVNQPEV